MEFASRWCVVLVSVVSLSGCASFQFAPPQSFDTNADIQALEEEFGTASSVKGYYAGTQDVVARNKFVTGRLSLINLQYVLFVREFAADKAQLDTAMDMLQLGVDLATAVVGGEAVKSALGAASSGITGTRASVKKNFFFEQTMPALITAMNAQRKETLIPIIRGLNADLTNYPFAQGVADLEAYYFAGTFVGGLQAIQRDAGQKEAEKDRTIEKILTIQRHPDYLAPDRVARARVIEAAIMALNDNDAIALSTRPPTQEPNSENAVQNQDPTERRLNDGDVARATLITRAQTDPRTEGNSAAWESALGK